MPTCKICGIQGKPNFGSAQQKKEFPTCKTCVANGITTPLTLPPMPETDHEALLLPADPSKKSQFFVYFHGTVQDGLGAGWGAEVEFEGVKILSEGGLLPDYTTLNQAEYFGLIWALRSVAKFIAEREINPIDVGLTIRGDSELVLRQMNKEYRVNDAKLALLYQTAQTVFKQGNEICIEKATEGARSVPADPYLYHPNRGDTIPIKMFPILTIFPATNDIMTSEPNTDKHSFIDAAFLVKLPGYFNELSNLTDPSPRTICLGSTNFAVLGVMKRPLVVRSELIKNARPLSLEGVVVLYDFCVPFHWALKDFRRSIPSFTVTGGRWNPDQFGKGYAVHPYHSNTMVLAVRPNKESDDIVYMTHPSGAKIFVCRRHHSELCGLCTFNFREQNREIVADYAKCA